MAETFKGICMPRTISPRTTEPSETRYRAEKRARTGTSVSQVIAGRRSYSWRENLRGAQVLRFRS